MHKLHRRRRRKKKKSLSVIPVGCITLCLSGLKTLQSTLQITVHKKLHNYWVHMGTPIGGKAKEKKTEEKKRLRDKGIISLCLYTVFLVKLGRSFTWIFPVEKKKLFLIIPTAHEGTVTVWVNTRNTVLRAFTQSSKRTSRVKKNLSIQCMMSLVSVLYVTVPGMVTRWVFLFSNFH